MPQNYPLPTAEKQLSESKFQPAQTVIEVTTYLLDKDKVEVSSENNN